MSQNNTLIAIADNAKCSGIDCAYKTSCGRYLRPDAGENQAWTAFYALADDDCEGFEEVL